MSEGALAVDLAGLTGVGRKNMADSNQILLTRGPRREFERARETPRHGDILRLAPAQIQHRDVTITLRPMSDER
jgi:hypothetical protein